MDPSKAAFQVELEQIVWLTCGREPEYQILLRPEQPAEFSWQTLLDSVFESYQTEGEMRQRRGTLAFSELGNGAIPFVAAAFDDPKHVDLHGRKIKHFMVLLNVNRSTVPEMWHLQLLSHLRPAFNALFEASRYEDEALVRRRACEQQTKTSFLLSGPATEIGEEPSVIRPPAHGQTVWSSGRRWGCVAALLSFCVLFGLWWWKTR